MASSKEFVAYAADQLSDAGEITYRKMFGEYGVYCDGKIFALICDDQLFVKVTEAGRAVCPDLAEAAPYEGSKPYFLVESIDDRELMGRLAAETCRELPMPKPKKKKEAKKQKEKRAEKEKQIKFDYKKEYKDLYIPKTKPAIIDVPEMTFIQVEGEGNPNTSESYKRAMEILYGLSFGIKMSKMSGNQPEGYFEYVVPPLEGLWWMEDRVFLGTGDVKGMKDKFRWISMIRQPEFVTPEVFEWAQKNFRKKNPEVDFSRTKLVKFTEGLCAQVMHVGPYDDEPATIEKLEQFITDSGYTCDIGSGRLHHEIYLGDPRRTKPERLKTVIRHPIKKMN